MTVHPGIMLRKKDQTGQLSYLYQLDDKDDNRITIAPHHGSVICVSSKQKRAVCKCPFGVPARGLRCATGAVKCTLCWRNFRLSGGEISLHKFHVNCHIWLYTINVCMTVYAAHTSCIPCRSVFCVWPLALAARQFDLVGSGIAGPSEVWDISLPFQRHFSPALLNTTSPFRDRLGACFAAVKTDSRRVLVRQWRALESDLFCSTFAKIKFCRVWQVRWRLLHLCDGRGCASMWVQRLRRQTDCAEPCSSHDIQDIRFTCIFFFSFVYSILYQYNLHVNKTDEWVVRLVYCRGQEQAKRLRAGRVVPTEIVRKECLVLLCM